MSDDATMIVSAYFDAWRAHDPAALRGLLADDATFTGPLGHAENADDYREAIGRMFAITTGIGDPDYLLRVVRDLPAYRQLYDERLATLAGVLRLSSTLVMKSVVDARPLPL